MPNLSDIRQGIIGLDDYYRWTLSKAKTRKQQKEWAVLDAAAIRWMLAYIFTLVRTQGGNPTARYETLTELKSMVRSQSALRRAQRSDEELEVSQIWQVPRWPQLFKSRSFGFRLRRAQGFRGRMCDLLNQDVASLRRLANAFPALQLPDSCGAISAPPPQPRMLTAHVSIASSPGKEAAASGGTLEMVDPVPAAASHEVVAAILPIGRDKRRATRACRPCERQPPEFLAETVAAARERLDAPRAPQDVHLLASSIIVEHPPLSKAIFGRTSSWV